MNNFTQKTRKDKFQLVFVGETNVINNVTFPHDVFLLLVLFFSTQFNDYH